MLISTDGFGEIRVALVKDNLLYDLEIETKNNDLKKANIYKGKISRIEPSLDAVFVDYGAEKHGFLPIKEIDHKYFQNKNSKDLRDNLAIGQELIVQVDKDERGNKGAALTTFISLAGAYLVLMPNSPKVEGISRQIDHEHREALKGILQALSVPKGCGIIVRTAGLGRSLGEIKRDLHGLLMRWEQLKELADQQTAPVLLYQEGNAAMRAVRDYLRQEIEEIWVDQEELFNKVKEYVSSTKADFVKKVKYYQGTNSLFSKYGIEQQIEAAFHRVVKLPSGGSISIDLTEALVSIDVNSAKATSGNDIEETAFHINLEAAEEIARHLRIRDLGGLIVIDFIDMALVKNQKEVCKRLKEALDFDRARVKIGNITRFGLLEMSRQRLRNCLGSVDHMVCPRCGGNGSVRTIFPVTASLLRMLEEKVIRQQDGEIQLYVPLEVATYLLNEQRDNLNTVINKAQVKVTVIPDATLCLPKFLIKQVKIQEGDSVKLLTNNQQEAHDSGVPVVVSGQIKEISGPEEIKLIKHSLLNNLRNCLMKIKNYFFRGKKKQPLVKELNKMDHADYKNDKAKNLVGKEKRKKRELVKIKNEKRNNNKENNNDNHLENKKNKTPVKSRTKTNINHVPTSTVQKVEIQPELNVEPKLSLKPEEKKETDHNSVEESPNKNAANNFYRARRVVEPLLNQDKKLPVVLPSTDENQINEVLTEQNDHFVAN